MNCSRHGLIFRDRTHPRGTGDRGDPPHEKLPRGLRLYHGTGADEDFSVPDGPAWFSDAEAVADYFKTWREGGRPRVLSYWLAESPALLLVRSRADFDAFEEEYGVDMEGSGEEMAEAVCGAGYDGWIIPDNYPEGADILLCDPQRWLGTEPPRRRRRRA